MTMNDLDLSNSFPNTFSQIDQTVLQDITKSSASRIDHHDLDTKIEGNVRFIIYLFLIITKFCFLIFNYLN